MLNKNAQYDKRVMFNTWKADLLGSNGLTIIQNFVDYNHALLPNVKIFSFTSLRFSGAWKDDDFFEDNNESWSKSWFSCNHALLPNVKILCFSNWVFFKAWKTDIFEEKKNEHWSKSCIGCNHALLPNVGSFSLTGSIKWLIPLYC